MSLELRGPLSFVGFGFGPIQAGLFVLEAFRSGRFGRIVIAEVMPDVVTAIREAGGAFQLNIAHLDRVEPVKLGPIEMEDPAVEADRKRIIDSVAEASEIATAVPSIRFYRSDGPGSIHRILAAGLERRDGKPAVVYAAENDNRAAETLEEAVMAEIAPGARDRIRGATRFLNTVIGKMSAVIADPDRVAATGLRTITSRDPRAFLVESFNRILISAARFPPDVAFRRGLDAFEEKQDLLPFEEAKLFGHNAAHALAAYLAALRGLTRLEELRRVPGAVGFVRQAFLEESGEALIRKWKDADALFSRTLFRAHVDDLLVRMLNPYLGDLVERVARDPERKLGWDDRLVGAIRLALEQGLTPRRLALGAAAAILVHRPEARATDSDPSPILEAIWRPAGPEPSEKKRVLGLVIEALPKLRAWLAGGASPFE